MPIHLPNALGAGQLFAYSGMEGDTDWYHPFICSTLGRQVGLEVRVPENLSFWIDRKSTRLNSSHRT